MITIRQRRKEFEDSTIEQYVLKSRQKKEQEKIIQNLGFPSFQGRIKYLTYLLPNNR